ncbi:hypothetical protein [Thiolapillus sp.]
MNQHDFPVLGAFLAKCNELDAPDWPENAESAERILRYYDQLFASLEKQLWQDGLDRVLLEKYRLLVAELDQRMSAGKDDERHDFMVVVPVADRPGHLRSCLESLLHLCKCFPYGASQEAVSTKISVLIADDSKEYVNVQEHRKIAGDFSALGLETIYFGQGEQLKSISRLDAEQRKELREVLGDADVSRFYHKGASIMRNITYIKLKEICRRPGKQLFYFVDSDQEFRINTENAGAPYAINYFYHLDRMFSRKDVVMITGKVVGDPPVSPSVMASNLLDDVRAFLGEITTLDSKGACRFHEARKKNGSGAAYHDMADLFGFGLKAGSFRYRCDVAGEHNHEDCLSVFAGRLNRFFHGEHPTRKTYFEYSDVLSGAVPARTVYTGNYAFNEAGLDFFIPFATLKLRMAGPTLGRLLCTLLGDRFVSANLPMLHKRTVTHTGQSEFRPGIVCKKRQVDLSVEFERQYYGDVMLFSMERLVQKGYPLQELEEAVVMDVLQQTERQLRRKYMEKQEQIEHKLGLLECLLREEESWWNCNGDFQQEVDEIKRFVANMKHNFGPASSGFKCILSSAHRRRRLGRIQEAISSYDQERLAWRRLMENG